MLGEHIRIQKAGRWVHAVDCGDETVLHLAEEAPPPRVRRAYRPEFVAGASAVEIVTHRERTFSGEEIVRRAYSRASDPALAAMFRDSEAFVEWCTTGRLTAPRNVAVEIPGVTPAAEAPRAKAPGPAQARAGVAAKPSAPRKPAKAAKGAKPAARAKAKPKAVRAAPARAKVKAKARTAARKPAKARPKVKAKVAARRGKALRKRR